MKTKRAIIWSMLATVMAMALYLGFVCLYNTSPWIDSSQCLRVDNFELNPRIQAKVEAI